MTQKIQKLIDEISKEEEEIKRYNSIDNQILQDLSKNKIELYWDSK